MMKAIYHLFLLVSLILVTTAFQDDVLKGWRKIDKSNSYEMKIEKNGGQDGKNCATIKSIRRKISGYGALSQSINADKYHYTKVRFSGYIKTQDVKGEASFWMRVDGKSSNASPIISDSMHDRSIKGSTAWSKYEIVLEVPYSARSISYGAMLRGTGQFWFDNLNLESVPDSIKTTNRSDAPKNLDFEE